MLRANPLLVAGLSLAAALAGPLALAEEAPPNVDASSAGDAKGADQPGFRLASQAARLAAQGEKQGSPLMLLAAAELLVKLTQSDRDLTVIEVQREGEQGEPTMAPLDPDALIEKARKLAKDQPEVLAAVETLADSMLSGGRDGVVEEQGAELPKLKIGDQTFVLINPAEEEQRLNPGATYKVSQLTFEGGKPAIVGVCGDGDGDLDLWVYDGNTGDLIGSDTDATSICEVKWVTRYQGPFTVIVKNLGEQWERFYLLANY